MDIVDRVSMWEEHKKIGLCLERRICARGKCTIPASATCVGLMSCNILITGAAVVQKCNIFPCPLHIIIVTPVP